MILLDYLAHDALRSMVVHALLAGVAVVCMCGVLSPLVVVKRLGFVGQGVSHSAFAGIGVAAMLAAFGVISQGSGAEFAVIIASCIAAALAIAVISGDRGLPEDSAIGIILAASMAVGAILVQGSQGVAVARGEQFTPQSWESILFGSILGSGPTEVWGAMGLGAATIACLVLVRRPMLFYIFDEESARAFGVPTLPMRLLLMVLLAVAVVTAMKVAGVVLGSALLVLPGAIALRLTDRLGRVMGLSVLIGLGSLVVGLGAALQFDLQVGPSIVLVMAVLFVATRLGTGRGVMKMARTSVADGAAADARTAA